MNDNIKLEAGRVYLHTPEGLKPFGPIGEVEETTIVELTPDPKEFPYIKVSDSATFSAQVSLSPQIKESFVKLGRATMKASAALEALNSICRRVAALYMSYPNGRVKHLALYAKKLRTRKKNMRRIGRELGGIENDTQ